MLFATNTRWEKTTQKKRFNCHLPFSGKKAKGKLRKSLSILLQSLVLTNFIAKKAYFIITIDTWRVKINWIILSIIW